MAISTSVSDGHSSSSDSVLSGSRSVARPAVSLLGRIHAGHFESGFLVGGWASILIGRLSKDGHHSKSCAQSDRSVSGSVLSFVGMAPLRLWPSRLFPRPLISLRISIARPLFLVGSFSSLRRSLCSSSSLCGSTSFVSSGSELSSSSASHPSSSGEVSGLFAAS